VLPVTQDDRGDCLSAPRGTADTRQVDEGVVRRLGWYRDMLSEDLDNIHQPVILGSDAERFFFGVDHVAPRGP
jgi:hypothetical protein